MNPLPIYPGSSSFVSNRAALGESSGGVLGVTDEHEY